MFSVFLSFFAIATSNHVFLLLVQKTSNNSVFLSAGAINYFSITFELSGRPDRACPLERIVGRRRAFHFGSQDFLVAG
jgi:hypothetical protein